jgi:hypothetical protein
MGLSVRQQWSLYRIEDSIRRSDPRLTSTMCAFPMFALDGEMPQHERLRSRVANGCGVALLALLRVLLVIAQSADLCWRTLRNAVSGYGKPRLLDEAGFKEGGST